MAAPTASIIALTGLLEEIMPIATSIAQAVAASISSGTDPSQQQLEDAHAATQRIVARGDAIMAEIQAKKAAASAGNGNPPAPADTAPPAGTGNA